MDSPQHELKTLIQSYHPLICIESTEEDRVVRLARRVSQELRLAFAEWSSAAGLQGNVVLGQSSETKKIDKLLEFMEAYDGEAVFVLKDFSGFLSDPIVARRLREMAQRFHGSRSTIVFTEPEVKLPVELRHKSVFLGLDLPSKEELQTLLKSVHHNISKAKQVTIQMDKDHIDALVNALLGLTLKQARQLLAYVILDDLKLSPEDIQTVLKRKSQLIAEGSILEYYPHVASQYQLGGFDHFKQWMNRVRAGFSDKARQLNLPSPKGALIVGVPGCGKSLAAKAVAQEWKVPLLKLDAGRLFDKYIGESEKNFQKAIASAESMAPSVLWIDEIEKAMSAGPSTDSDGGLSRRIFGAFLTWLQEKKSEVFVIATANQLDQLPPELLRKGRFDEVFFVDLPNAKDRKQIFEIHIKLRNAQVVAFDLDRLVKATSGYTGAEIEQAVIGAGYRSICESLSFDTALILDELKQTQPLSVSRAESIRQLRESYRTRFVNVAQTDGE